MFQRLKRLFQRSPQKPPLVQLSSHEFDCYQAGFSYGAAAGFKDTVANLDKLHRHQVKQIGLLRSGLLAVLPGDHRLVPQIQALDEVINGPLGRAVDSFRTMADAKRKEGESKAAGLVKMFPPMSSRRFKDFMSWTRLVVVVVLGSVVAQAGIAYASRHWW